MMKMKKLTDLDNLIFDDFLKFTIDQTLKEVIEEL